VDPRKVIAFGNASFVISLPKKWLIQHNIKKGGVVYLDQLGTDLILSPGSKEKLQEIKGITIDISGKDTHDIKREIVSAYLKNNTNIKIVADNMQQYSAPIREILNSLIALEIMQETSDRILIKDFLDINTVSVANLIKKTDAIVKTMMYDLKQNLQSNSNTYANIIERDKDINKLHFLLLKTIRNTMDDLEAQKRQQIKLSKLSDIAILNITLERIGDDLKRITRYIERLHKQNTLNQKFRQDILKVISLLEEYYASAMKAFYKQDPSLAYITARSRLSIDEEISRFLAKYKQEPDFIFQAVNFKNILNHTRSIVRLAYK
jgi:phosphate uptake regulator